MVDEDGSSKGLGKDDLDMDEEMSIYSSSVNEDDIELEILAYRDMMGMVDYDMFSYRNVKDGEDKNLLLR